MLPGDCRASEADEPEIGRLERAGNLEPKNGFLEVRDTDLKGLILRIRPSGQRAWYYQYRTAEGGQTRIKLGDFSALTPDGARVRALAHANEVRTGRNPVAEKRAAKAAGERARLATLRVFIQARYEPWARTHLKSAKFQLARLKSDFKDDLDRSMRDFDQAHIEGIRQRWTRSGLSPKSVNRDLQRLQSVLSRAVDWGVLDKHPFSGVVKPLKSDNTGRVRFLEPAEEQALRESLRTRESRIRTRRMTANKWRQVRRKPLLPEIGGGFADILSPYGPACP